MYYDFKIFFNDHEEKFSKKAFLLVSGLQLFFIFLFKNQIAILTKFFVTYALIIVLTSSYNIINSNLIYEIKFDQTNDRERYKKTNKNLIYENFYLIIFDEATSTETFDENYNTNLTNKLEKNKSKFHKFKNSYANYDTTTIAIGSFLNIGYIKNKENRYQRLDVYPFNLYYRNHNQIPLTKLLGNLNIDFHFFSSDIMECRERYFVKCKFGNTGNKNLSIIQRNLKLFYNSTYFMDLFRNNLKENEIRLPINEVLTETSFGKNKFFLIHNLLPHRPYNYEKNCKKIDTQDGSYKKNYECAMKYIIKVIKHLEKFDPKATILITSDTGTTHHNLKKELLNFKTGKKIDNKIITLLKSKNCKNFSDKKLNHNISIFRKALNCSYSTKFNFEEYKFFVSNKENLTEEYFLIP